MDTPKPNPHDIRRIAVVGLVSPKTIAKFFRSPSTVRPICTVRIVEACRTLGIPHPDVVSPPQVESGR